MEKPIEVPATLLGAIRYFSDPDICLAFLTELRWPHGVRCPRCDSERHSFLSTRRIWKCAGCKRQFSIKVGTIFEDSPLGLDKWLPALWMIVNAKNGVSSYEIARALGVTQKTAWFMLHRIRLAMQTQTFTKLSGEVEVDESFIGGKARNKVPPWRTTMGQKKERKRAGLLGKVAVMGLLARHGKDGHSMVRTRVLQGIKKHHLEPEVHANIEPGAEVFTDALRSYDALGKTFVHQVINHAEEYAHGKVHTNGLENFWSLLKRTIRGTYVNVEPFHLFRYLDEQSWRFNNRKITDGMRFWFALRTVIGRRLTYRALTAAEAGQTA
jgi:transposase-like protein